MIVRRVRVRQEHYDKGNEGDNAYTHDKCTIALAMKDAGFSCVDVQYGEDIIVGDGDKNWIGKYPKRGLGSKPFTFFFVGRPQSPLGMY